MAYYNHLGFNFPDFYDEDDNMSEIYTPSPLAEPNFDRLRQECIAYIEWMQTAEFHPDGGEDRMHWIFEEAMQAVFGKDIFDWVNKFLS